MTQFIFCNSYCLPGSLNESNDIELQKTKREHEKNQLKKQTDDNKQLIQPTKKKKKTITKSEQLMDFIKSRASVRLTRSNALEHYKILNDNSVYSSCGSQSNTNKVKKKKEKVSNNIKPLEKSRDRNTDRASYTPTTHSNNQILNKLSQEKSNDKSNNSKSIDKVGKTETKDHNFLSKNKSKNPKNLKTNPESYYDINQAYTKLSKKKSSSVYDENIIYGMPSSLASQERQNKNLDLLELMPNKSNKRDFANESINGRDNEIEIEDDDNQYEEEENEMDIETHKMNIKNNLQKSSVKNQTITTPNKYDEYETLDTDKIRYHTQNKNIDFILHQYKLPNKQESNKRYLSNPPNKNLSHVYDSKKHYNNNDNKIYSNSSNKYNLSNGYPNPFIETNSTQQNRFENNRPQQTNFSSYDNCKSGNYIYPRRSDDIEDSNTFKSNLFKDPSSCSYCEEFYKLALFQSYPLQLFTCPYCKNTVNQTSLQFYFKKYEEEINLKVRKSINADIAFTKSSSFKNSQTEEKNNTLNATLEYNNISTNPTKNLSIFEENKKDDIKYNMNKRMQNVEEMIFEEDYIDSGSYKFKDKVDNLKNNNNNDNSQYNSHSSKEIYEIPRIEEDRKMKEVIMIKIDDDNKNESENLAEMFKKKKLGLIEKLEKRKFEKENKFVEKEKVASETIKPRSKHKLASKKEETKQISLTTKLKEPSQELLHRLSLGEKANLSKKEIKDLNMRMISTLPEEKKQENDEKRKQDYQKRIENTKTFSQKLKDDVIRINKKG